MARRKIKPVDLSDVVAELLEEYGEDVFDVVDKTTKNVAREASEKLQEVRSWANTYPSSPYSADWTSGEVKKTRTTKADVVYNRDHYQLAHLLEHGHATRNGGRTGKYPHIRPVEEWAEQELEDRLRRGLE